MQEIGPFQIEGELGRGGAGVVLRARDRRTGRPVALKLLTAAGPAQHARRRFVREVQALSRLEHPHVVRVVDAGEHGGLLYLAMELVDGQGLQERLDRAGPLPPAEVAQLGLQLARALGYAHGLGLVHRDVKPGNVLLGRDGAAKLVDFGLVRDMDGERSRLSRTGVYLGTPGYWAPEQALGQLERIGPATDVYGLGATLYAALCGQPPHVHEDLAAYVHAAEHERPVPPRQLRREVDPTLERVLMRCLERDPLRRYQTAGALGDELEAWARGERDAPPPRRAQTRTALAAGALLLVGLGGAGLTLARRRHPGDVASAAPVESTASVSGSTLEERARGEALLEEDPAACAALAARLVAENPLDARARRLHGLALLSLGRRTDALPELESALAAGQDDPLLRAGLAMAKLGARDPLGGQREAELATARAPQLALAHRALGEALWARGELRRAEEELERALQLARETRPVPGELGLNAALATRSRLRYERGDLRGALQDISAALLGLPQRVDWLVRRAELRTAAGQGEAALADLDRALHLHPQLETALTMRAEALRGLGRLSEALRASDQAVQAHPHADAAWLGRARILLQADRPGECEAALDRVLALQPTSTEALALRADVRRGRGALEESLSDLEQALAMAPDEPGLWLQRAATHLALDQPELVLQDTDRVLELAPDCGPALALRGTIHHRLGDDARAKADLDRAVTLDPDAADVRVSRAMLLRGAGQPQAALADVERVLSSQPGHLRARLERGRLRLAGGDAQGAREDSQAVLAERAADPQAHLLAGLVALVGDEPRAALEHLDRALELDPRLVEALVTRARAWDDLAQPDRVQADLARALALRPGDPEALTLRGRFRLEADQDLQPALRDLDQACAADPRRAESRLYRAVAHERLGDLAAALADYDRALELRPDYLDALLQRCTARMKQNDFTGMQADAERIVALAPGLADGWLYRAMARLFSARELDLAQSDAERAVSLAPAGQLELARVILEKVRARRAEATPR